MKHPNPDNTLSLHLKAPSKKDSVLVVSVYSVNSVAEVLSVYLGAFAALREIVFWMVIVYDFSK